MAKKQTIREQYGQKWEAAAVMVAKGEKTRFQIAQECGFSYALLKKWIEEDGEFQAVVAEIQAEIREQLQRAGITSKVNRIAKLAGIAERIEQVIEARSKNETVKLVAGGESGLIAHDVRFSKTGDPVDIGRFDAPLVKEFREVLKQVAVEVGEWNERTTSTQTVIDPSTLDDEQLDLFIEQLGSGATPERAFAFATRKGRT